MTAVSVLTAPAPQGSPLAVWVLDVTVVQAGSDEFVDGRQSVHLSRDGAVRALAAVLAEFAPAGVFRMRESDRGAENALWAAGVPISDPGESDGGGEIIASHCDERSLCVDLDVADEGVEVHAGINRMVVDR